MRVVCSNCGDVGPEFWVTLAALLVAAGALGIAFREHRVFMRELAARAKFRLIPSIDGADADNTIRTNADSIQVRGVFGLKNDGDKAAGTTVLNVLVSRTAHDLRWCGQQGEDLSDAPKAGNTLEDFGDGHEVAAYWLAWDVPRVARRPYYVKHFAFWVDVPRAGEVIVPVRMKAQADELPDDIDEEVETLQVRIVRPD